MSIMDILMRRATTKATLISITSVYSETTGSNTDTEVITELGKCIFYEGSIAKSYVSDSMREQVSGVALFRPQTVINGTRMRIDDSKVYAIIGQENIANQNKVRIVYLGEIS